MSLVFLPHKVQIGEKTFKVKVFNSLMIMRTPSRASQSTYIRTDWLNYVRSIELTDQLKEKINFQPDWLANQSSLTYFTIRWTGARINEFKFYDTLNFHDMLP